MSLHSSLSLRRHVLESVDSTNSYVRALAIEGEPEGTLVMARTQSAGRGRHGNQWQSLAGNLFASLLLRPNVKASDIGQLSFVVAVALAKTIRAVLPNPDMVGLKWPNDILLSGKKCAGILLESETAAGQSVPWVVAGFGVNLAVAPENAVSLTSMGAPRVTPEDFLDRFEPCIAEWYDLWRQEGFAPIQAAWSALAVNLGKTIRVRLTREDFSAVFEGIDLDGALCVRLADGTERRIASGEVYL